MQSQYFKTFNHNCDIFEKSFQLLIEKKIEIFDEETINSLIDDNQEQYQLIQQRPKFIKESSKKVFQDIFSLIQKKNNEIEIDLQILEEQLSQIQKDIFKAMGISHLLPIQQICFKYCIQNQYQGKQFISFDTGQGKTSLCLGIATYYAYQGQKSFIINKSQDLSFRDFKKASCVSNKLKLSIGFYYEVEEPNLEQFDTIYFTFDSFLQFCKMIKDNQLTQINCIFDEYDAIFFQDFNDYSLLLKKLQLFNKVFAFSGSTLEQCHQDFIKTQLKGQLLNFSLSKQIRIEPICINKNVFSTFKDYKDMVKNICLSQMQLTLIVLIINSSSLQIKNTLISNGIQVENLIDADASKTESLLQFFTQKQNSVKQFGTRTRFGTNKEIEDNGGVYVIIGTLPNTYLLFNQFIGRTGRIQNKGQYQIVLYDKDSKNQEGESFINKKLLELKNKDLINLNVITHKLNKGKQDKNIFEEEKSSLHLILNESNYTKENKEGFLLKNAVSLHQTIEAQEWINTENILLQDQQDFNQEIINLQNINDTNEESFTKKRLMKQNKKQQERSSKRLKDKVNNKTFIDQSYFNGCSKPEIHEQMVNDVVRMEYYEQAIQQLALNYVIIDVGAGTGILSMMAATGAKLVFAVEQCQIASVCLKAIKDNNLQNQVHIIQGLAEEVELPIKQVDLIISEWMGYFLLYENMLPNVISVREKYLKEDGQIIPKRACIYLAAIFRQSNMNGLNLSSVRKSQTSSARIDICKIQELISEPSKVYDVDLLMENITSSSFESEFALKISQTGVMNGFVGWFSVDLTDTVILSTSPFDKETHWKQTIFMLNKDFEVNKDELLEGQIFVKPQKDNYRALQIRIEFKSQEMKKVYQQSYNLD